MKIGIVIVCYNPDIRTDTLIDNISNDNNYEKIEFLEQALKATESYAGKIQLCRLEYHFKIRSVKDSKTAYLVTAGSSLFLKVLVS